MKQEFKNLHGKTPFGKALAIKQAGIGTLWGSHLAAGI
jgi:hypothetical protein